MKRKPLYFSLVFLCLLCSACIYMGDGSEPIPISSYDPVVVKRSVLESSTTIESAKPIVNSGKIYIKDHFLFVGEKNEGFHVFDNSDPNNPVNKAFIKVLGASDLTIKGEILYINNATDLIAIKPNVTAKTLEITKRVVNAFPQMPPPDNFGNYSVGQDEVIVNWKLRK